MPSRVRFEHQTLTSGQHAVTSPDITGFCVVAATSEDAVEQAMGMLMLMRRHDVGTAGERIAAIEFEAA